MQSKNKDRVFVVDEKLLVRFWSKASVRSPEACWPWKGASWSAGNCRYGSFRLSPDFGTSAHRMAYHIANRLAEWLPPSLVIRHMCNNSMCVNPNHLLAGTQKDNAMDCVLSGRRPRGERCVLSKLTEAAVEAIRKAGREEPDVSLEEIGARFGVTASTVSSVLKNKAWKADPLSPTIGGRRRRPNKKRLLFADAFELLKKGYSIGEAARRTGLSAGFVGRLVAEEASRQGVSVAELKESLGVKKWRYNFDPSFVREVKRLREEGWSFARLGTHFGITPYCAKDIVRKRKVDDG